MEHSGVTISSQRTTYLSNHENIRPTADRLLVELIPLESGSSMIEVVSRDKRALKGIVKATGPGVYPWKYNAARTKRWLSNVFRKTQALPGEVVYLEGFQYPEVVIDNTLHVLCREEDVVGIELHGGFADVLMVA